MNGSRDGMDAAERQIRQVLEALGGVEAPLGLEGRVLAGLAEKRAQRKEAPVRLWATGLAFAGMCVVAGVMWVDMGRVAPMHGVESLPRGEQHAIAGVPGDLRRGAERSGGWATKAGSEGTRAELRGAESAGVMRRSVTMRVAGASERSEDARSAEERLAVEEMRAASMPEATLPLTEGERLLMRVAEGNSAAGLAKRESGGATADAAGEGTGQSGPEAPVRRLEMRSIGTVLQAGLFAGMKTATNE